MATVRVTYYGMEGTGKNVTEAKRDAGAKIEQALSGNYTPEIVAWRGWASLVYREPSGWHTRLIADPTDGVKEGRVWGTCYGTFEEALRSAQSHVADLGWTEADGFTPPDFLKTREQIADYRSQAEFRIRWNRARAAGLTSTEAHDYAGLNPGRHDLPELIARVEGQPAAPAVA